jgi:hypothetical protein
MGPYYLKLSLALCHHPAPHPVTLRAARPAPAPCAIFSRFIRLISIGGCITTCEPSVNITGLYHATGVLVCRQQGRFQTEGTPSSPAEPPRRAHSKAGHVVRVRSKPRFLTSAPTGNHPSSLTEQPLPVDLHQLYKSTWRLSKARLSPSARMDLDSAEILPCVDLSAVLPPFPAGGYKLPSTRHHHCSGCHTTSTTGKAVYVPRPPGTAPSKRKWSSPRVETSRPHRS